MPLKKSCRCLTKPCKRCAFARADRIANVCANATLTKYALKHARKTAGMPAFAASIGAFTQQLQAALHDEKGLAHGKAREYWLRRGPRLFCTATVAVACNVACGEIFKGGRDRVFSIVYGVVLLAMSLYMLYQRLPDAVEAAMMRIGHDHYTAWKRRLDWTDTPRTSAALSSKK